MFIEGQEYSRVNDIHKRFSGQRYGGICTPQEHPYILIFTGASGQKHGYQDGWQEEGVFLYTGEGQVGDMKFKGGNAAIRDHDHNGKELLLFQALGRSKPVRFIGSFACQSWDTFRGPDREGHDRECIQFHLVKLDVKAETGGDLFAPLPSRTSLEELRRRALAAAQPKQAKSWREAPTSYRVRSRAVREYVLMRASGRCELTGQPAPFRTRSGDPYLEVHHTRRLFDDGPDDPRFVAAICPTVHREIHFGECGEALNLDLIRRLKDIEG